MVKNQQIRTITPAPSELDRVVLGFEYNKTIQEIRQEIRKRSTKD